MGVFLLYTDIVLPFGRVPKIKTQTTKTKQKGKYGRSNTTRYTIYTNKE